MPAAAHDAAPATSRAAPARTRLLRRAGSIFTIRWFATILALACATIFTFNFWAWPQLGSSWCVLHLRHGAIEFNTHDPDVLMPEDLATTCLWLSDLPGYDMGSRFGFFRWKPSAGLMPRLSGNGSLLYFDLPLWLPFAALTATSIITWRTHLRRRHAPQACPHCHYDLTGLPASASCPECGRSST